MDKQRECQSGGFHGKLKSTCAIVDSCIAEVLNIVNVVFGESDVRLTSNEPLSTQSLKQQIDNEENIGYLIEGLKARSIALHDVIAGIKARL